MSELHRTAQKEWSGLQKQWDTIEQTVASCQGAEVQKDVNAFTSMFQGTLSQLVYQTLCLHWLEHRVLLDHQACSQRLYLHGRALRLRLVDYLHGVCFLPHEFVRQAVNVWIY